jgi:hypothetical protein
VHAAREQFLSRPAFAENQHSLWQVPKWNGWQNLRTVRN